MRDLEKHAAECMKELDRLNIRYSKSISFVINTRAVTRLGLCKKLGSSYVIEISELLLDERTDLKRGLKTTVIHELLHTCRGCMKHTGKWAELAAKVNAACGYNVTRVTRSDESIIPEEMRKPPFLRSVRFLRVGRNDTLIDCMPIRHYIRVWIK